MFHYEFMQHAFVAGSLVAIMCGVIGVFVVARGLPFIAHTFSHIGFSGAAFAVWAGWNPINGLLLFTTLSALAIGRMGVKYFRRDASISVILSFSLGLGLLFLSLSSKQAGFTSSILFGSVIGISANDVLEMSALTAFVLLALTLGYKMLKFDSFDPLGAQAAGLPVRSISVVFLLLLAVAVAEAVQIVGALLVFALMTIPAAAARNFVHSIFAMLLLSSSFSLLGVWAGLILSYYTNAPVSFYITSVEAAIYFLSLGWMNMQERRISRA